MRAKSDGKGELVVLSDSKLPTEDQEQMAFIQWCDAKHLPVFHVNNEMWTRSWKQKMRAKAMGVRPGVPDLFVVLPTRLVAIEMKRSKGGRVSDAQRYWLRTLNLAGVEAHVCRGCAEAIQFVTDCLKQAHSGAEGVK